MVCFYPVFLLHLGFLPALGRYVTTCDGLYTIATNIIIQGNTGKYTLAVLLNGEPTVTATNEVTGNNRISTLNIVQTLRWKKGAVITLQVTSNSVNGAVNVLKSSSWSMSFVGEQTGVFNEFSIFGTNNITVAAGTNGNANFDPLTINLPEVENKLKDTSKSTLGQFISPPGLALSEAISFQAASSDLFYVAATIHVKGEATDIEAVLAISQNEDNDLLGTKGISSRVTKLANADGTISLAGVIFIQKGQSVNIFIGAYGDKSLTVTTASFFSMINMRYIVSSVSAQLSSDSAVTTNTWSVVKQSWKVQSADAGLYAFGKDFDNRVGEFTASHSGIHIIHANVHISLGTSVLSNSNNVVQASLSIDGVITETNIGANGFYAILEKPKPLVSLRVYGILNLRAGQKLSLMVKSGSASVNDPYRILQRTSLTISYIGPKWAVPSFFALTKQDLQYTTTNLPPNPFNQWKTTPDSTIVTPFITDSSIFSGESFVSKEDAIYAICVSMVVLNPTCSGSTYFSAKLRTGNLGVAATHDIGIGDKKYVLGGTERSLTLSFSATIRLRVNEKISVSFDERDATGPRCQYTLSRASSFSLVRWGSVNNPSWNPMQYVGFFATTSGDKLVKDTLWQTFTADTLTVTNNVRPGMYLIAQTQKGFDPGTASYSVIEPAIFLISARVRIRAVNQNTLNGVYQAGLQIGGGDQDIVSGLYSQTTQTSSDSIELTFTGTMFLSADQEVRVVVQGSGDTEYIIDRLSSFSMAKLQQDYKTPGIIMEDRQTITTSGITVPLTKWDAENKLGLTER